MRNKMSHNTLPFTSLLLVLGVAIIWGFNFIVVSISLEEIPPLTLCAIRFLLASIPGVFFLPKPKISWKLLVGYAITTLALPFAGTFLGMYAGVPSGTAALIIQLQVFFAIFFAVIFAKQSANMWQIGGALIAFSGIIVIALHRDNSVSGLGIMIILLAGITWAVGNLISSHIKNINILSLVSWGSLIAFFPIFGLALLFEHPLTVMTHPQQLSYHTLLGVAYITYASTHFGYGSWAWLLNKYPIASIAPFSLLAPIVALLGAAFILQEPFELWKMTAAFLVLSGLALNVFGQKLLYWLASYKRPFAEEL